MGKVLPACLPGVATCMCCGSSAQGCPCSHAHSLQNVLCIRVDFMMWKSLYILFCTGIAACASPCMSACRLLTTVSIAVGLWPAADLSGCYVQKPVVVQSSEQGTSFYDHAFHVDIAVLCLHSSVIMLL